MSPPNGRWTVWGVSVVLGSLMGPMGLANAEPPRQVAPASQMADTARAPTVLRRAQSAAYKVTGLTSGLPMTVTSAMRWAPQADQTYVLTYQVDVFLVGQRKQVSQGRVSADGLEPLSFTDQGRRTQVTQVNADQKTVKLPNHPTDQPWTPGTQDRLSVMVQLGARLAAEPSAFAKGESWQLWVWSSREAERWGVVSQGVETLNTPYGPQTATRLTHLPQAPDEARIDWWYVPQWGPLPVRIEMVEANGNRAEQTLSELDPAPPRQSP